MNNGRGAKKEIPFIHKEIIAQDHTTQNNWKINDKEKPLKRKNGLIKMRVMSSVSDKVN